MTHTAELVPLDPRDALLDPVADAVTEALEERRRTPATDALLSFIDRFYEGDFPDEVAAALAADDQFTDRSTMPDQTKATAVCPRVAGSCPHDCGDTLVLSSDGEVRCDDPMCPGPLTVWKLLTKRSTIRTTKLGCPACGFPGERSIMLYFDVAVGTCPVCEDWALDSVFIAKGKPPVWEWRPATDKDRGEDPDA